MRKILKILVLIIILALNSSCSKENKLYTKALESYNKNNMQEALKTFKEVIEINPKNKDALMHLGLINTSLKDYDQCIYYLKESLNVKEDPVINSMIADCYMKKQQELFITDFNKKHDQSDFNNAKKYYLKARDLKGDFAELYIGLSNIYLIDALNDNNNLSYYDLAIENAIKAEHKTFVYLKNFKKYKEFEKYKVLGFSYFHKGLYLKGIDYIKDALIYNEKGTNINFLNRLLGLSYIKLDNYNLARDYFKIALNNDEKDSISNFELGKIYFKSFDFDSSEDYFKKSINLNYKILISKYYLSCIQELKNMTNYNSSHYDDYSNESDFSIDDLDDEISEESKKEIKELTKTMETYYMDYSLGKEIKPLIIID